MTMCALNIREELAAEGEQYYKRLSSFARKLCGSNRGWRADYEDLVQETMLKIVERADTIDVQGDNLFGILGQILYRKFLDEKSPDRRNWKVFGLTGRQDAERLDDFWDGHFGAIRPSQEHSVFLQEVMQEIEALPSEQREALMSHALGHSARDIATESGESHNTVAWRIKKSVKHLEPLLGRVRNHKNVGGKYRGVVKHGRKWRATISVSGKRIIIGSFATEEEAARAYSEFEADLA